MPYFQTMGIPCAVGLLVAVAVALTLVPAAIAVGSRFGFFDPRRRIGVFGWGRVGTAIVRWPVPILVCTCVIALLGLLTLPGYKTSYNARLFIPNDIPSNVGFAAADRHFSQARMMPEVLMIELDHDMRNPSDFLVLNKLAKGVFKVPGISRVQGITRPEGTPIDHTSIPFLISMQNASQLQSMTYMKARVNDFLKEADDLAKPTVLMERMYSLAQELTETTHHTITISKELSITIAQLLGNTADFEDFWRPIRSYFYWEKHCYDIPICWSLRSIFDIFDGVDALGDKLLDLMQDVDKMDQLLPQLLQQMPMMIANMESIRSLLLTMHSSMAGSFGEMDQSNADSNAMGQAFDAAKNDDTFYLPPEIFQNPDFQHAMSSFLSPDGKAARFIISQRGDPATPAA